jgi:hypothetical protein
VTVRIDETFTFYPPKPYGSSSSVVVKYSDDAQKSMMVPCKKAAKNFIVVGFE